MLKALLAILFSFWMQFTFAQTDSSSIQYFELTGKFSHTPNLTPDCGTLAWAAVFRVEIESFSDSSYASKSIGIIAPCPEFYKDGFEMGRTYKFTLANRNTAGFGFLIPEQHLLEVYPLKDPLWITKIEKSKN